MNKLRGMGLAALAVLMLLPAAGEAGRCDFSDFVFQP